MFSCFPFLFLFAVFSVLHNASFSVFFYSCFFPYLFLSCFHFSLLIYFHFSFILSCLLTSFLFLSLLHSFPFPLSLPLLLLTFLPLTIYFHSYFSLFPDIFFPFPSFPSRLNFLFPVAFLAFSILPFLHSIPLSFLYFFLFPEWFLPVFLSPCCLPFFLLSFQRSYPFPSLFCLSRSSCLVQLFIFFLPSCRELDS